MDHSDNSTQTYSTRKTLIERVKDQYNESAWKEFANIYTHYIYAVIRNMNISEHDTEEIHQKVMVKLWKKLPQMDTDQIRRFRSYLAMVAKNEVKQFIRSRSRRQDRETRAVADASMNYLNSIRLPEIEKIAEREWQIHLTNLALKKIEPHFSKKAMEVFRLSIEGVPPDEIARRTGIARNSINTLKARVKSRFFAEIQQLREDLQ
ncbi:RNA polymerase sigma factor [Pontiella agarivorans]|uniref:RNA polymerase sigma factor SigS n=1 Tax=Pontiella agarivorans TaxID=3038953 RepID=A0ABU5MYA6_9BACT|nr:sigma-70 family RNA polymerase sigma factor [Pontiella agarivorans]MDZ8119056.1 sigma-70 family RNA polymerase sigma factor [Pontiella agarivorans]